MERNIRRQLKKAKMAAADAKESISQLEADTAVLKENMVSPLGKEVKTSVLPPN